MRYRCILARAAVLLAAALILSSVSAAHARMIWVEGTVTAEPRQDRYCRIEVDGKSYTVMPRARISVRYEKRPGALDEKEISCTAIVPGERVMMRVDGNRIHQILIYD